MTNREKIDYLKQYKFLDRRIDQLLEEKEKWRTKAEQVTSSYKGMPRSAEHADKISQAVTKMIECEEKIAEEIDRYTDLRKEMEEIIKTVGDEELEMVLSLRYIDGRRWEEVAVFCECSWRHIHRLHSEALSKIKINSF